MDNANGDKNSTCQNFRQIQKEENIKREWGK